MKDKSDNHAIRLTIIGKDIEVEKMQKRLRCAARATNTEIHLSWRDESPQHLNILARESIAVTCYSTTGEDKLLIDGLKSTEDIETLLTQLEKPN